MVLRNLPVIACVVLASCAANPIRGADKHYNEYTVQLCMPNVGTIVGNQVAKHSIATLFSLPVGSTVDGYRVYQADVLETQRDPLQWIVVDVQSKGQKRYFSYSSGNLNPKQVGWSAWRSADYWTHTDPSMSYVYGGTAVAPIAPGTGSPVMRYRVVQKQDASWIIEHRLHGESKGFPSCNEK